MFGRSTSSRFGKDSKEYTPGPGEYDAKHVATTSKRGASMGIGARSLVTGTSEFAHLGPGAYSHSGDSSFADGRRGTVLSRTGAGAVDFDAAMKKLGTSLAKVMGATGSLGTQQKEFNRDDICTMASKLVADALASTSDAMRFKGELDSINSRVKDEVQAALKPSKSSGNPGNPAAWKLYVPLEKAVDNASSDLAKKLSKLSLFLTTLHEDFPALMVTMADGDRIGQLSQTIENLQTDLDEAIRQAAQAAQAASSADSAKAAVERELVACRRQLLQHQARADKLDDLMTSHKKMMQNLEEQLEASHARNDEMWRQLCAARQEEMDDTAQASCAGSEQQYQHLVDQCKEARDSQEQTMQDIHALQAQMTHVMADAELKEVAMEERMLREADVACDAADDMLSEIDECHAIIKQSYRDKRVIRAQVSLLEAKQRALKGCVEAESAEVARMHALVLDAMTDSHPHPHCLPSPSRLGAEALEAIEQLDKSATHDVLVGLGREEELRAALEDCEGMLADATLELSQLQRECEARTQQSHTIETQLRETIQGLMHSHAAEEGDLRAQAVQQHAMMRDVQRQLHQASEQRDHYASQASNLQNALMQLQQEFSTFKETSRLETEECEKQHGEDERRWRASIEQLQQALEQQQRERDAQREDLLAKAWQVDDMAVELEDIASAHAASTACADAGLARIACALKQLVAEKAEVQAQLCRALEDTACKMVQSEGMIAKLESEVASAREALVQAHEAFDSERRGLEQQLEASEAAVLRITSELKELSQANVKLSADKEWQAAVIEERGRSVEVLTSELARSQVELEAAIGAGDASSRALQAQIASLQEHAAGLNDEISQKVAAAKEQAEQAADLQERLDDAQAKLEASCMQIGELQGVVQDKITLLDAAGRQSEEAAAQQSQLQEKLKEKEDELARRATALEQAAAVEQDLGDSLAQAQGSLAVERQKAHALEHELAQARQEVCEVTGDRDAKAGQLQEVCAALEQAGALQHRLEAQVQDARQTHSDALAVHAKQLHDLKTQHAAALEDMQAQHAAALEDKQAQHAAALEDMQAQHAAALEGKQAQHAAALEDMQAQLQAQHAAALEDMQAQHALQIGEWQGRLKDMQDAHSKQMEDDEARARKERRAVELEHECALQQLKHECEAEAARREQQQQQHADAVKTQLCNKLQEAEQGLADATDWLQQERAESGAAREQAARQLAAAESKMDLLAKALKGTEKDKAAALAAFSSMYQQTDEQLKALAAGAGAAPHADSAALSRIATLQAELESSMMERSECLQQLQVLQTSEREAAAHAIKHREKLEMAEAEIKAMADRMLVLQADNAKLSAENVQLVGHSNLKQRINIFNNVKDENNALKKEKTEAERLVAQQRKVIERLQVQSGGADKENACLLAKMDQEEKLQAALKESDAETRALRKHLLTLLHHVQTSAANTPLGTSLKVSGSFESGREVLCDNNKGLKQRDWGSDVRETERIIDALTTHVQQQQREVAGAQLKIHLLEQSARIIAPTASRDEF